MSDPGFEWRVTLKRRISVVAVLLALWVTGVEARLIYLQIFQNASLTARAVRQQSWTRDTPAKRGDILDRRGHLLATSVDVDSIYAVPTEIDNGDETCPSEDQRRAARPLDGDGDGVAACDIGAMEVGS